MQKAFQLFGSLTVAQMPAFGGNAFLQGTWIRAVFEHYGVMISLEGQDATALQSLMRGSGDHAGISHEAKRIFS